MATTTTGLNEKLIAFSMLFDPKKFRVWGADEPGLDAIKDYACDEAYLVLSNAGYSHKEAIDVLLVIMASSERVSRDKDHPAKDNYLQEDSAFITAAGGVAALVNALTGRTIGLEDIPWAPHDDRLFIRSCFKLIAESWAEKWTGCMNRKGRLVRGWEEGLGIVKKRAPWTRLDRRKLRKMIDAPLKMLLSADHRTPIERASNRFVIWNEIRLAVLERHTAVMGIAFGIELAKYHEDAQREDR